MAKAAHVLLPAAVAKAAEAAAVAAEAAAPAASGELKIARESPTPQRRSGGSCFERASPNHDERAKTPTRRFTSSGHAHQTHHHRVPSVAVVPGTV